MANEIGRANPQPMMVATMAIWKVSTSGPRTLPSSSTQSQGTGQNFSHSGLVQISQNVENVKPT